MRLTVPLKILPILFATIAPFGLFLAWTVGLIEGHYHFYPFKTISQYVKKQPESSYFAFFLSFASVFHIGCVLGKHFIFWNRNRLDQRGHNWWERISLGLGFLTVAMNFITCIFDTDNYAGFHEYTAYLFFVCGVLYHSWLTGLEVRHYRRPAHRTHPERWRRLRPKLIISLLQILCLLLALPFFLVGLLEDTPYEPLVNLIEYAFCVLYFIYFGTMVRDFSPYHLVLQWSPARPAAGCAVPLAWSLSFIVLLAFSLLWLLQTIAGSRFPLLTATLIFLNIAVTLSVGIALGHVTGPNTLSTLVRLPPENSLWRALSLPITLTHALAYLSQFLALSSRRPGSAGSSRAAQAFLAAGLACVLSFCLTSYFDSLNFGMFHLLTAYCFLASGLLALCLLAAIDWRAQRLSTPVLPASFHHQQLTPPTLLTQSCSLVRARLLLAALLLLTLAVGAPLSVFSLLPDQAADPWIEALFALLYLLFLLTAAWELRGRAWLALTWELSRRATPAKWSPTEVSAFLHRLQLTDYCDAFRQHSIDGPALLALGETDFQELGLSIGHRKLLLASLNRLRSAALAHCESGAGSDQELEVFEDTSLLAAESDAQDPASGSASD